MGRGPIWMPIAATLCLFGVGGAAWVRGDQAEVRERLARFVAERDATRAVRHREAVYGETLDGNACDDYVEASALLKPLRLGWRHFQNTPHLELTQRGQPLSVEARQAVAPSLAAALAHIRRGVRRGTLRFPERRNVATFEIEATLDDAIDRAVAARDGRSVAELFVDRWVLKGDLWPSSIHRPRFHDEWLDVLDRDSASWLANALLRLDARSPVFASALDDIANCVRDVANRTPLEQSFSMGLSARYYGFDWFWRELVFCDRLLANLHELEPPAQVWRSRQQQLDAFDRVLDSDRDAWMARIAGRLCGEERNLRRVLTNLRLLRLTLAFAHGLELPQLEDPLGNGPIAVDVRGDEATFRSEGMDGKKRLERTVRRR